MRAHRFKRARGPVDPSRVIEALLVFVAVALLAGLGLLAPLLRPEAALLAGAGLAAAGLLLGVPTGFWYHVRLRAVLAARDELPERWWLRPTALHARLRDAERTAVLRWFVLGGAGFVLTVLGCAVAVLGIALATFRQA